MSATAASGASGDNVEAFAELVETMNLMARPGLSVRATPTGFAIELRRPARDHLLLEFLVVPRKDDWATHHDELVQGFDEFNDTALDVLDGVGPGDTALAVAQDLRNRAIVDNASGWYGVLRFNYGELENDIRRWLS